MAPTMPGAAGELNCQCRLPDRPYLTLLELQPVPNIIENPATPPAVHMLHIDADDAGQRLDNCLLRVLKGVPKTHVYRIIRSGEVRVNRARAQADTRLAAGDVVRIPPLRLAQRDTSLGAPVPARGLPVLHEDEALLVIDKPAGLAVHGGSGLSFGLIEQLRAARPQARFLELVHRLDRETSGLLLVAKKRSALTALQAQFRERQTGKTYLALVQGAWPRGLSRLDAALRKSVVGGTGADALERRVTVVPADHPDAMSALSLVRPRHIGADWSWLEVTIKTGRTHQIRVHLAHAGHPILGDDKYGDFALNKALARSGTLRRMALHAWRLNLNHPISGERVQWLAPWPADLQPWTAQIPCAGLDAAQAGQSAP